MKEDNVSLRKPNERFAIKNEDRIIRIKAYAIYVLDEYSVHLMPKVRQALFKKGYVLVVIGGGIPGDIQMNDISCHHNLKKHYREFEINLMLE